MKKFNSISEFIDLIKERTAMYIGGRTLTHLKAFIDGWLFGAEDVVTDTHLLIEFQDYLVEKFQVKSSQSWDKIILFYSNDEYDALKNFFSLFDEFMNENNLK